MSAVAQHSQRSSTPSPSRQVEAASAHQSESAHIVSSSHDYRTITSYTYEPSSTLQTTSVEPRLVKSSTRRTTSETPSLSLHTCSSLPSTKALGKRKRVESDERNTEASGSPSKQSRLSAWRKHAGRYLLTPLLGPAEEVVEPPALPAGTSDYDASSEGSSQRSSTSPLTTTAELPTTSTFASRSGPFRFVGRRPPVCSPAPSYTNLLFQPFSPGSSNARSSCSRLERQPGLPRSSAYARPPAVFSPRTRRTPYASIAAAVQEDRSPASQTLSERGTHVTILPALSVRVRNSELPLHASPGTPAGRSRLLRAASPADSPLARPPRRSRILPAGTAEPCSSLGSGTIVFFNEMNEVRAYRVARDVHTYAEKFVRTRPVPPSPSPGTRTPIPRIVPLREPVRCLTPDPPRCATPEPLDIFPQRHSPQPSLSGDSASTLCMYSPQLSKSLTLVNDSDDALF